MPGEAEIDDDDDVGGGSDDDDADNDDGDDDEMAMWVTVNNRTCMNITHMCTCACRYERVVLVEKKVTLGQLKNASLFLPALSLTLSNAFPQMCYGMLFCRRWRHLNTVKAACTGLPLEMTWDFDERVLLSYR